MIKSEIFRKGYYGFSLLISIGVLVLGIWVQSIIPQGCISKKLRSSTRAMITLGTIMSVLNLSVFLCSKYCNIKDPENTSSFMLFLMLITYIITIVYIIQTISGINGAQFPAPVPNKCTTYSEEKNCEDDKLCWWDKNTELCNYKLKSCIPNNKTILAVLGVLTALVVVMVIITIAFLYFKTKKEKTGPSAKEIADQERIEREREKQEKRDEEERKKKEKEDEEQAEKDHKENLKKRQQELEEKKRKEEEDYKKSSEYKANQLLKRKEYNEDIDREIDLEQQIAKKEYELNKLVNEGKEDESKVNPFVLNDITTNLKRLQKEYEQLKQKNIDNLRGNKRLKIDDPTIFASKDNLNDSSIDFVLNDDDNDKN